MDTSPISEVARRTSKSPRSDGALAGGVRPVAALTGAERARMHALLGRYFEGVTRAGFEADLAEKDVAVLLRDAAGTVQGFSTLLRMEAEVDGRPLVAFFSGDTIVDASHRTAPALAQTWSRHVFRRAAAEAVPTYWFLISSGYKTYRFLPTFFRRFWPNPAAPTPPHEQALLDTLARRKFPGEYDPGHGVVRLRRATPLRPGVAEPTARHLRDPHVAFFVRTNPGSARGDELACLTRIHPDNLTPAGRRMVGDALVNP